MKPKRTATATFINQCNCITTRNQALRIEAMKEKHRVESPVFLQQEIHEIDSVLYKNAEDDVAAYWGVVKVSYKI